MGKARTPIAVSMLWITAAHMVVCAGVYILWLTGNDSGRIELFFRYQGALSFVGFAAWEFVLAWKALRQFSAGEPLHIAWFLIALASFYRLAGYLFSQILNAESYLNPIYLMWGPQGSSFYQTCRQFGVILGGPLSMAILVLGLFFVLRTLRRLKILSRLQPIDYVLISAVAIFTLRQIYEIGLEIRTVHPRYDLYKVLAWPSDLLLSILLIEAVLIRRSAVQTGWGLIAKSWGAFCMAIVFTSLGDVGIWATTNHYYIPWPYSSATWCVWFLASAAYALGPAYQVEAYRRAYREARQFISAGPPSSAKVPE